jgi:hypothetical protein
VTQVDLDIDAAIIGSAGSSQSLDVIGQSENVIAVATVPAG